MRFRSILLLGVSSVALQHADAQTAGVNGVPGSTVIVPRQVFFNRPIYVLPGAGVGNNGQASQTPSPPTTIYMPPSPFGPLGQLPRVTDGLPGYNAPLHQTPFPFAPGLLGAALATPAMPVFGANAPVVGQSLTDFASKQPGAK